MQFSEDFKETTVISHYWILWLSTMGECSDSFSSFYIKRRYLCSKHWRNENGRRDWTSRGMEVLHGNTCNTRRETAATGVFSTANPEVCKEIKKSLQVYKPVLFMRKAQTPQHVCSTRRHLIGCKNFIG